MFKSLAATESNGNLRLLVPDPEAELGSVMTQRSSVRLVPQMDDDRASEAALFSGRGIQNADHRLGQTFGPSADIPSGGLRDRRPLPGTQMDVLARAPERRRGGPVRQRVACPPA